MSRMAVYLMLIIALSLSVAKVTEELMTVHCVKPSNSHEECRNGRSNTYLCEKLQFYLSNVSLYLTSNTTLEFLPGEHFITDIYATITEAKMNLKLTGENKACLSNNSFQMHKPPQIICSGEAGLVFQRVENLTISYLSFVQCGQSVPYRLYGHDYGIPKASLAFDTVTNLILQSLVVFNGSGYGLLLYNTRKSLTVKNCDLIHNHGSVNYLGGNALVNYIGTGCFANDSDRWPGAQVEIVNSTFLFGRYEIDYENNTLATGLAITLSCSNVNISMENVTVQRNQNSMENSKGFGGNVYIHYFNQKHLISNRVSIKYSHFLDGSSWLGAGIGVSLYVQGISYSHKIPSRGSMYKTSCENILLIEHSIFKTNAAYTGSGIYVDNVQNLLNNNCTASITLSNCSFSQNLVRIRKNSKRVGNKGVITFLGARLSKVTLQGLHQYNVMINDVTLEHTGVIVEDNRRLIWGSSALYITSFFDSFQIKNCTFQHNNMTAIFADRSYVIFSKNIVIHNNTAANGGGILLCSSSNVIFTPNTSLLITNNHALRSGGGIFVEDSCPQSRPLCFYQMEGVNACGTIGNMTKLVMDCNISIAMINNTADYAGSQVFGGNIGNCYIHQLSFVPGHRAFLNIFHPQGPTTDLSSIASNPKMICFCINSTNIKCGEEEMLYPELIYPGENVTVPVVIVGQLNGTIPGQLQVNISNNKYISFNTHTVCTDITFTAYTESEMTATYALEVFAQLGSNISFSLSPSKYLRVHFKDCPKGYILNKTTCGCNANWKKIHCDFMKLTLTRTSPAWLGFMNGKTVYQTVCPNDYCTDEKVHFKIDNGSFDPDKQCAPHRTGILCGACKENFSLSGRSSDCVDCTRHPSMYLSLYICGQLLCGLALIVLLTYTNWTITDGTSSGLLFYANIFKLNLFMFLPRKFNAVTIVIFAFNMDFHFSKCLYNGLDAYAKAWLSFVFPVYMWLLIAAIIYLSRYFDWVAKLFGRNGTKILATLIELSYAGLTQAVVIALSPVQVDIVNPHTNQTEGYSLRWVYDPNITYLETKHFLLFVTGIVFGLLILAYTLILLFIQPLQRYSHLRCFSWVAKLKPLTDAYTSPHIIKKKCQFWPGLLLFVRLVIFAFNTRMDKNANLVAILSGCLLLIIVAWCMGGIYTRAYLNILNAFFILNLAILCALLMNSSDKMHLNYAYISSSLAVLIVCTVLLLHVILRLKKMIRSCCKRDVRFLRNPMEIAGRHSFDTTEDSSLLYHNRD